MATDPGSPQVVASLPNEQVATAIIEYLNSVGIEAHVWGADLAVAWPEVPFLEGIRVVVRQADVGHAREALAAFQLMRSEVNWEEIDVGEPE